MHRFSAALAGLALAGAGLCCLSVPAASKPPLPQAHPEAISALLACREQTDAALRVDCYDRAVDALNSAIQKKDVVVYGATEVRQARRSLFGFSVPQLPLLNDSGAPHEAAEINSKVISARSLGYGKWRVQIDDGALWETTEPSEVDLAPRAGELVRIRKAALGSYFMIISGGRAVRARRVG